ncbi:hypothetical protein JX266_011322 [Neoarthrinium moseri]|nr:hypothetical protein JX266_011322 [Neoarthrinium moseri]
MDGPARVTSRELNNTGDKPFVCPTCGRAFSRNDSLTRHVRIHGRTGLEPIHRPYQQPTTQPQVSQQVVTPTSVNGASDFVGGDAFEQTLDHSNEARDDDSSIVPAADYSFTSPLSFDGSLAWPDAEQLLQTIVSSDWSSLTLPPDMLAATPPSDGATPFVIDPRLQENHGHPMQSSDGSAEAIQSLSNMITSVSSRVTTAVEKLPGLTSAFLDNCLQTYFIRFNPSFPILHRPTFVFRECSPSLLLNAIALGSLFIGTEDAVSKGEALWRLAYTAVATSWQSLLYHRGMHDSRNGVQLALTALLGQTYAMLSKNETLRVTSQVYHSLGFSWARHCNLFDLEPLSGVESLSTNGGEELAKSWKAWVAREQQLRALLGHYILDGQLSFLSGQPTSVSHVTNPLVLSGNSRLFDSQSAAEWLTEMKSASHEPVHFRQLYFALFEAQNIDPSLMGAAKTDDLKSLGNSLDVRVVLECIHSLVRETRDSLYVHSIGSLPSLFEVKTALFRVYRRLEHHHDPVERLVLLLRWHFVCLDTVSNSMHICTRLIHQFQIQQNLFGPRDASESWSSIVDWVRTSPDAKRALLHATAIQDIAGQLPLSHINSMWMPIPIFAAAIIFGIFCLNGLSTVTLPHSVDWSVALDLTNPGGEPAALTSFDDQSQSKTQAFLGSSFRAANLALGHSRNLRYDFNSLQTIIHGLSVQWGVCCELESVLHSLKAHCP